MSQGVFPWPEREKNNPQAKEQVLAAANLLHLEVSARDIAESRALQPSPSSLASPLHVPLWVSCHLLECLGFSRLLTHGSPQATCPPGQSRILSCGLTTRLSWSKLSWTSSTPLPDVCELPVLAFPNVSQTQIIICIQRHALPLHPSPPLVASEPTQSL